jgi:hypothetical protein
VRFDVFSWQPRAESVLLTMNHPKAGISAGSEQGGSGFRGLIRGQESVVPVGRCGAPGDVCRGRRKVRGKRRRPLDAETGG